MFLFFACAEEPFTPIQLGTVSADGASGEAWYAAAWGYDQVTDGGHALLVVVAPRAASCEEAAAWVSDIVEGDDYDPTGVVDPGTCTTTFTTSSYDPAGSSVSSTEDDPDFSLFANEYCAMPGGSWSEGDEGWSYSGDIWSGTAKNVQASVSGGDGAELSWSIDADGWDGGFPYDSTRVALDAEGTVVGEGVAGWCDALAASPVFGD